MWVCLDGPPPLKDTRKVGYSRMPPLVRVTQQHERKSSLNNSEERVSNARGQQDDFELRASLSIPEEDESTLNSPRKGTSSTTQQVEASQPTASLVEEEDGRVDAQGLPSHVYTQTAAAEGPSRDHNEDVRWPSEWHDGCPRPLRSTAIKTPSLP
ncbi:hypothetical protein FOZ63_000333 [Perkinsus olseni]|uniref:Uncharacterized protein n=1 Tax=Perkinsus olseni TaxID=32597 RepID=A0A7J6S4R4_PEROL|nr:hypothetical protein FOZ63_000333 [Perkinsus olseni]